MDVYTQQLEELLQEEKDFQFTEFTNQTAFQLGNAIIARAIKVEKLIAVDIRRNGQVVFNAKGILEERRIQNK